MAKKASEAKVVQLQQTDEMIPYENSDTQPAKRIRITIDGRTALLTHNPQSMGNVKEAGKGSRIPDPEDEAEAGCYRMDDGTFAIKGDAPRGSILGAAGAWKGKNRSTMRSALAHIVVLEELIQLQDRDGNPLTSYEIDRRRAIVQKQGIIRARPRFNEWSCTFTVEFDPLLVPKPVMICDILQDAGGRIGVGDYRPARNGWFGRFAVRRYQILD